MSERSGASECVRQGIAESEDAVSSHPYGVTAHLCRIREEKECAREECYIEYIHTGAAEYLLTEDDSECHSKHDDPQRTAHRQNHWDDDTADEVAFLNLFALPLCPGKLDAETYDVADENLRQYSEYAIDEHIEERTLSAGSCIVLIAYVVHAEEQGRKQCYHHHTHYSL